MVQIHNNYSLSAHNTFGLKVTAARFVAYDSENDLRTFLIEKKLRSPFLHIGAGSNLLFTTDFYNGTVLHSDICGVHIIAETSDDVRVRVGAGTVWDDFVTHCVRAGWYGVENLSFVPGEVGASAVQNIGAYGVEAKDVIDEVEGLHLDGTSFRMQAADCDYSYRHSIFKTPAYADTFITYVTYRLSKRPEYRLEYAALRDELEGKPLSLAAVREIVGTIRRRKLPDPQVIGNAGSFFMNPVVTADRFEALRADYPQIPHYCLPDGRVKIPAAWLIEQCGWKGKPYGRCAMYEKQSLVLVNLGDATGSDVVRLSDAVRASVRERFGIEIIPEVKFIS
ncbi:MAG: UDP-N-acetylmuramate dehydrogenase [Prevotellaceae bacterium]|jgi:UDP-N-acetylmuramate dehydrogenase|nr:UDP-N-acetylmuramate dehydrogenase [Prevotellaceae bacterium]